MVILCCNSMPRNFQRFNASRSKISIKNVWNICQELDKSILISELKYWQVDDMCWTRCIAKYANVFILQRRSRPLPKSVLPPHVSPRRQSIFANSTKQIFTDLHTICAFLVCGPPKPGPRPGLAVQSPGFGCENQVNICQWAFSIRLCPIRVEP